MRPCILCLICSYFISTVVCSESVSDLKKEQIQTFDWAKIEWEKKAPLDSESQDPIHTQSPKNNEITSPRRASAPLRKKSVTQVQKNDIQARRHNSAPILRLRINSGHMMTQRSQLSALETPDISPTHMTLSQELLASPIDYFDPRFASAATPDELKNCGITRESVEDAMKQRHNEHLRENLQQGLLTCSLCMNTFDDVLSLQTHLQNHLS